MRRPEPAPLHTQLPWFGFAGSGTVLTKSGVLLAGARLRGAPFECRSADELAYAALRWTRAMKSLAPGWRIRWQARKRRLADLLQRDPGDTLSVRARDARNAHLLGKGLYSIETAVYWLWNPRLAPAPPLGRKARTLRALRDRACLWLSQDRTRRILASDLGIACGRFESAVAAFRGLVDDVTLLEPLEGEGPVQGAGLRRQLPPGGDGQPVPLPARP